MEPVGREQGFSLSNLRSHRLTGGGRRDAELVGWLVLAVKLALPPVNRWGAGTARFGVALSRCQTCGSTGLSTQRESLVARILLWYRTFCSGSTIPCNFNH